MVIPCQREYFVLNRSSLQAAQLLERLVQCQAYVPICILPALLVRHRQMKIAYLILAHGSPKHLARLVAALSSNSATFFIHVDRKSDILPFAAIQGQAIRFSDTRIPVYWGDFSQVEATLTLLRAALDCNAKFERFVLLSGADYPVSNINVHRVILRSECRC